MKTTQSLAQLLAIIVASGATASAVTINLLTAGATGDVNGATFTNVDVASTGTGVIEPFLRVQANGTAEGYNSDLGNSGVMPDVKTGTWTHELLLSAVPVVTRSGVNYYEFLLDINQTANNPLLSLDALMIYTRSGVMPLANTLALLTGDAANTLRWSLDGAGDSTVLLNYDLNPGSGAGDMFAYIPTASFAGASGTDNVYFYSKFGGYVAPPESYSENDGFEEWAVRAPGPPTNRVPDGGATLALLGLALSGLGIARRVTSKA